MIINGGVIGGRNQTGTWKIDARYNTKELIHRITAIGGMQSSIVLSNLDALKFLSDGVNVWPASTLIYLDPPYYIKGRDLYPNFYASHDHGLVAEFVQDKIHLQQWIVSYDNVDAIRTLYKGNQYIEYRISYSAHSASVGSEIMFFSEQLSVPSLIGAISALHADA